MGYRLGIDLGGTKIEVLVLDPNQRPVYRERVATPAHSYDEILATIADRVISARANVKQEMTIGIGIPGAISPATGLLRNSNTVCMNGRPFLGDIEKLLECEVRVENDANCFTLSEALGGAAKDYRIVFGVIIGTGTGGGLVIDGRLVNGPHSISGEWGHNPLPWHHRDDGSPACFCGKTSCIETFISGPGFAQSFETRFGRKLSSKEIIAAADSGDAECRIMMDIYHDQMARALAHVINIVDPHAIVLGGGMSNIDSIYAEIPRRLPEYVFSDFVETSILKAERGDASGVYGAALLWE
ncbi:MAG: ROK family protein [Gammaproteobacteria bacterium]|nr:ROK family protein [Gammaproteobacteria bacterium]MDH3858796.1 ROK family protein [Gammaproteobacteria bacterium]